MKKKDELIFRIYGDNYKKLIAFQTQHEKTCRKKYPDSLGTMFVYRFIPTSLGCLRFVECPCGEELDISDSLFD